jgi:hypothetical protein
MPWHAFIRATLLVSSAQAGIMLPLERRYHVEETYRTW